jgi:predicted Zn-dependent protease
MEELMNLPKDIKVGAIRYELKAAPSLADSDLKLDGRVRHHITEINIDADLNHQAAVQTILHELVHIVAIQLGHSALEEDAVDAIAYAAYQVLRDNPDLVKIILK